jgi:hypothetical protein
LVLGLFFNFSCHQDKPGGQDGLFVKLTFNIRPAEKAAAIFYKYIRIIKTLQCPLGSFGKVFNNLNRINLPGNLCTDSSLITGTCTNLQYFRTALSFKASVINATM